MVLAGAFGTWYWTNPKSSIRRNPVWSSLKIATKQVCKHCLVVKKIFKVVLNRRFHLGTLALGSLVLALVQLLLMLIRAIFRRRLENSDCLPCCSYFQSLIRDMIKYLNKIVYIVTMMRGTGFVDSAKETFKIFSSAANVLQIVVIKQASFPSNSFFFRFFLQRFFKFADHLSGSGPGPAGHRLHFLRHRLRHFVQQ